MCNKKIYAVPAHVPSPFNDRKNVGALVTFSTVKLFANVISDTIQAATLLRNITLPLWQGFFVMLAIEINLRCCYLIHRGLRHLT